VRGCLLRCVIEGLHHIAQGHPPLLTWAGVFDVHHARHILNIEQLYLAVFVADERSVGFTLTTVFDQKLDAAHRQARGLDAVKGRGIAALLEMAQDSLTHLKQVASFPSSKSAQIKPVL